MLPPPSPREIHEIILALICMGDGGKKTLYWRKQLVRQNIIPHHPEHLGKVFPPPAFSPVWHSTNPMQGWDWTAFIPMRRAGNAVLRMENKAYSPLKTSEGRSSPIGGGGGICFVSHLLFAMPPISLPNSMKQIFQFPQVPSLSPWLKVPL